MTKCFGFWRAVLAVLAAPALSWPISVQAEDFCAAFNTPAFFSAATPGQVRSCIEEGADVLAADADGLTPIFHAVMYSQTPTILDALLAGAKDEAELKLILGHRDAGGRSIMHVAAAEATDPAFIVWLVSWDSNVSATFDCGQGWRAGCTQPIHLAARREDGFPFVAALLALGADKNPVNRNGRVPAEIMSNGNPRRDSTVSLLSIGSWPDLMQSSRPVTPTSPELVDCTSFLTAGFFRKATASEVEVCLSSGSSPSATDLEGNTAVHLAAANTSDPRVLDLMLHRVFSEDPKKVESLLRQTNLSRRSVLHYAAEFSSTPEVIGRLIAWGADINQLSEPIKKSRINADRGTSALHIAARRADPIREQILTVLLAGGANATLRDYRPVNTGERQALNLGGRQALHYASNRPDLRIFKLLSRAEFSQRSNTDRLGDVVSRSYRVVRDEDGRTALHVAAGANATLDIIADMVKFGFSPDEADGLGISPLMRTAETTTDAKVFFFLLESSQHPCVTAPRGVTIETLLNSNENLQNYDLAGAELSPLAAYKARCPS